MAKQIEGSGGRVSSKGIVMGERWKAEQLVSWLGSN